MSKSSEMTIYHAHEIRELNKTSNNDNNIDFILTILKKAFVARS